MGAMEAFAIPEARDRLQDAVDALVDESIDGVSTHALGADLVDIRRAVDRLEAEFIRRLHRFHCARGAQADGGGSTVSWLRRCGMTAMGAAPVERFMTVPRTQAMFRTLRRCGQWDGRHLSSGVTTSLASSRLLVESPTTCGACASTA